MKSFGAQFGNPTGPLGWAVGHLMAVKNGTRSRWALGLLAARPGQRVLEIGCGPGVDLARLAKAVGSSGRVIGVDISVEMVRQATARNRSAAAVGEVAIHRASAIALPLADASVDAVYSTNAAQFWPDLLLGLREVARVLSPGGRAVIVVQPMRRGGTEADANAWAERLCRGLAETGAFQQIAIETKTMRPAPGAAASAVRAPAGEAKFDNVAISAP